MSTFRPRPLVLVLPLVLGAVLSGCAGDASAPDAANFAERLPFQPRTYAAQRAPSPPTIDGRLTEAAWSRAAWTAPFVNSEGRDRPAPPFRTRAKMMWDDRYLYLAARLEEPDVRASFTTRDTTVWRENAFEVFIDPTGDTHHYYEFQINARETQWDLMLTRPYRDGGVPISAWDLRGLKKGVAVQGTLNDPSDTDTSWTVELALPWAVLAEAAPDAEPPSGGDRWRINLTRMQWPASVVDGAYVRDTTGNDAAAWSPQGQGSFHMPERWGVVEFSDAAVGADADSVRVTRTGRLKWALRRLYYRQRAHRSAHGTYAASLDALGAGKVPAPDGFAPTLRATQSLYEITTPGPDGTVLHIRQDGRVWTTTGE
jgi:hypothetical protein